MFIETPLRVITAMGCITDQLYFLDFNCRSIPSCQPYLVKDLYTLFPSLRIPRCHVGMDDTAYTLSSSSNFGIRHQHLLVFHPTFRVRHVCNDQLPLLSHMNFTIQLVTNEVRLRSFKLRN